jgi:hypothetical protein
MSAATALDGLLDPLGGCLEAESARRVVELRVSPPVQQRVDTLAERANNGVLTSDEAYLTAIDPETREVVPLFHPRSNDWAEHFIVESERIIRVTAVGRATVQLLAMTTPAGSN